MLPLPPGMVTTLPTPPAQLAQSGPQSLDYSHYVLATQSAVAPRPMPWWIWAFGGALAVGLGIAGALWYSGRSSARVPAPAPAPPVVAEQPAKPAAVPVTPTVQPVVEPVEPTVRAEPTEVPLEFDSLPVASVYADGRSAELCKTPCRFTVNLDDGGPTDKRVYVVRANGYEDKRVTVDLTASKHDISVTLDRIDATPKKTSRRSRPTRNIETQSTPDTAPEPKPEVKIEPPKPPPEAPKPVRKIDRTDTMDPFSKK
jgi:hypothetical protein